MTSLDSPVVGDVVKHAYFICVTCFICRCCSRSEKILIARSSTS